MKAVEVMIGMSRNLIGNSEVLQFEELWKRIELKQLEILNQMKESMDEKIKRNLKKFEVGERVMAKTNEGKWEGPMKIKEVKNEGHQMVMQNGMIRNVREVKQVKRKLQLSKKKEAPKQRQEWIPKRQKLNESESETTTSRSRSTKPLDIIEHWKDPTKKQWTFRSSNDMRFYTIKNILDQVGEDKVRTYLQGKKLGTLESLISKDVTRVVSKEGMM